MRDTRRSVKIQSLSPSSCPLAHQIEEFFNTSIVRDRL